MTLLRVLVVLFLYLSTTVAAQELVVLPDRLQFRGATPGGKVAFFGWAVETRSFFPRFESPQHLVEDEDGDGIVAWQPMAPLTEYSFWVAFDLQSGRWSKVLLPSFASTEEAGLTATPTAGTRALFLRGFKELPAHLGVWVVRPGQGVWGRLIRDGSMLDKDGLANGQLVIDLGDLVPVESSEALTEMREGDWLFWAEIRNFAYGEVRVAAKEGSR